MKYRYIILLLVAILLLSVSIYFSPKHKGEAAPKNDVGVDFQEEEVNEAEIEFCEQATEEDVSLFASKYWVKGMRPGYIVNSRMSSVRVRCVLQFQGIYGGENTKWVKSIAPYQKLHLEYTSSAYGYYVYDMGGALIGWLQETE